MNFLNNDFKGNYLSYIRDAKNQLSSINKILKTHLIVEKFFDKKFNMNLPKAF